MFTFSVWQWFGDDFFSMFCECDARWVLWHRRGLVYIVWMRYVCDVCLGFFVLTDNPQRCKTPLWFCITVMPASDVFGCRGSEFLFLCPSLFWCIRVYLWYAVCAGDVLGFRAFLGVTLCFATGCFCAWGELSHVRALFFSGGKERFDLHINTPQTLYHLKNQLFIRYRKQVWQIKSVSVLLT